MAEGKKLYRSQNDRIISGVCGGIAEHFGIDSTLVRVIFLLLVVAHGLGLLLYLALALIVPAEGKETDPRQTVREGAKELGERAAEVAVEVGEGVKRAAKKAREPAGFISGLVLVIVGIVFLLDNLGFPWPRWLDFDVLWPLVLVGMGVYMLMKKKKEQ
ncbi:MAG: PspC domain-containing protein [Deltaproteobacteria bacterium]|nr:MAG: PspC domain-containing protein [Deltaproteobacteria bacterium]